MERGYIPAAMKKLFLPTFTAALLCLAAPTHAATSETLQNLRTALVGETNAAHRYAIFAQQAETEQRPQAARLFRAAAKSESIHRDRHRAALRKLGGDTSDPTLDAVKPGTTAENLRAAIAGESHERDAMYPAFIAQARAEDARDAVRTLQGALSAEKEHARLFQEVLDGLDRDSGAEYLVCSTCGYTVTKRPTDKCPVCRESPKKFNTVS